MTSHKLSLIIFLVFVTGMIIGVSIGLDRGYEMGLYDFTKHMY